MKHLRRIAAFTLIASLIGLSGCIWPYDGNGGRGGGDHEQRRGGEDHGGQGRQDAGCGGEHRRDDCNDEGH